MGVRARVRLVSLGDAVRLDVNAPASQLGWRCEDGRTVQRLPDARTGSAEDDTLRRAAGQVIPVS